MTADGYVCVDKNMKTNLNDVFAAGDITSFPRSCLPGLYNPGNEENVSIAHWGLASQQGRSAALSIINQTRTEQIQSELKVVPFFSSTMFGNSLRFSGYNQGYTQVIFHSDSNKFAAFYIDTEHSNKVTGVCTLNHDPICAIFAELMFNEIEVRVEHVKSNPMDIKKLLLV